LDDADQHPGLISEEEFNEAQLIKRVLRRMIARRDLARREGGGTLSNANVDDEILDLLIKSLQSTEDFGGGNAGGFVKASAVSVDTSQTVYQIESENDDQVID
jgi:hypothetical protein